MPNRGLLAQRLPSDVLRLVLQYVTSKMTLRGDTMGARNDGIKEMLYVCSAWRQAALEYMWRELNIDIDAKNDSIHIFNPSFAKHFRLPNNIADTARELNISVPISSILSGSAFKLLSEYMQGAGQLPLVRRMLIMFNDYSADHKYSKDVAVENTLAFAQLLQSMTLAAKISTEL
ncbi:hypothetical protein IWW38_004227, partial [Coemansia aciculifera]